MTEPEVQHLILQVYKSHTEIDVYKTSRVVRANCGHLAWVSPVSESMLTGDAYSVCSACYEQTADAPWQEHRPVPGSLEHLAELEGPEARKMAENWLRRKGWKP